MLCCAVCVWRLTKGTCLRRCSVFLARQTIHETKGRKGWETVCVCVWVYVLRATTISRSRTFADGPTAHPVRLPGRPRRRRRSAGPQTHVAHALYSMQVQAGGRGGRRTSKWGKPGSGRLQGCWRWPSNPFVLSPPHPSPALVAHHRSPTQRAERQQINQPITNTCKATGCQRSHLERRGGSRAQ